MSEQGFVRRLGLPVAVSALVLVTACGGGGQSQGHTQPDLPPPTDTVSGTVRHNGTPVAGAQVFLFSTNFSVFQQTVVTDSNGNYTFAGLSTQGNVPADWLVWTLKAGYGFYPAVSSGAAVMRCGQNAFLQGYNMGGVGLDVTAIHFVSLPNASLAGADFNAFDQANAPVVLARTGQVTRYAAGDDGDLHKGVDWPGLRFSDHQDGTVTDLLTGLTWLKNSATFSPTSLPLALAEVNQLASGSLGLSDGSKAGDWRLPNLNELESLVDISNSSPALPAGHPFSNVSNGIYWTSTGYTGSASGGLGAWKASQAWAIRLGDGRYINDGVSNLEATSSNAVWAVKGGALAAAPLQATGLWCSNTPGDDGQVQSGIRLTYPRWIDNGDGTSTDTVTGLVWMQQAGAINLPWSQALAAVNGLHSGQYGLTDGSVAGSWRMPSRNELQSLADRQQSNHADYFNNVFRTSNGQLYQAAPFTGFVPYHYYWTASTAAFDSTQAWAVFSCDFGVYNIPKTDLGYTLAVR